MKAIVHTLLDTLLLRPRNFARDQQPAIPSAPAASQFSDLVMQGNLIFNREYGALMKTLLAHAPGGIDRCWLSLSGT
ncbi:MAG: hypothetical protein ACREQR_05280, partial [Candidatus Binataceae bacterium]